MTSSISWFKREVFDNSIVPVLMESMRLFPDGIVITSGIYALLTLSYPFAVLFGSLIEASLLFNLIRWIASYLHVGDTSLTSYSTSTTCRTGFSSADLSSLSLFGNTARSSFPSAPVYILTVAASYIFSSLNAQSADLQAMGPAYANRYYISLGFMFAITTLFMLSRLYFSCDTFGTLIITAPIGVVVGALLLTQNRRLFGPNAVNLVGIPTLMSNK